MISFHVQNYPALVLMECKYIYHQILRRMKMTSYPAQNLGREVIPEVERYRPKETSISVKYLICREQYPTKYVRISSYDQWNTDVFEPPRKTKRFFGQKLVIFRQIEVRIHYLRLREVQLQKFRIMGRFENLRVR